MPGRGAFIQAALTSALIILALWGATQWTAGEWTAGQWTAGQWTASGPDRRHDLGAAWFRIGAWEIYHPWQLFLWWYCFGDLAPELFARAGILVGGAGLVAILVALIGAGLRLQGRAATTYGSARWATRRDIRRAGLHGKDGVILGLHDGRYLRHGGLQHVLALAPTRSGKGVGLVIPTLLSWSGSVIVHDIKGENWQMTAGLRARISRCIRFDPTRPDSARYNPLLEVRRGDSEIRDVQNIADILVDPEGALERRNHWEKTSHSLLVGVILHVLYAEADKSLSRVAALLADPERDFEQLLADMMATNHLGTEAEPACHPVVASVARELLNKAENERSGVLSTAIALIALYRDPVIARLTARSDFTIAELKSDTPVSLYLVVPPSDLTRCRPLIRLILNQIGRRLTEQGGSSAAMAAAAQRQGGAGGQPLLLMLDEFPALGRLDFFESALAFMAGYGIRAFLIAQSLNQLTRIYGENSAILDNCHIRIAFACNDERTAKRLSDSLGTATEQRLQRNFAGARTAIWLNHVVVSRQETARPLLTPGEIMQLPEEEALVLLAGLPPIRARKLRYYRDGNFTSRILPPPSSASGHAGGKPSDAAPDHDWNGATARPMAALRPSQTPLRIDLLSADLMPARQAAASDRHPSADAGAIDDFSILDDEPALTDLPIPPGRQGHKAHERQPDQESAS